MRSFSFQSFFGLSRLSKVLSQLTHSAACTSFSHKVGRLGSLTKMRCLALRAGAAPSCPGGPTSLKRSIGWSSHIVRRTDGTMTGPNFCFMPKLVFRVPMIRPRFLVLWRRRFFRSSISARPISGGPGLVTRIVWTRSGRQLG